jgi:hypothetical protein
MKFRVTYSDGTVKEETSSDCSTVEQFINSRFGTCSALDKIKVELIEDPKPKTKK